MPSDSLTDAEIAELRKKASPAVGVPDVAVMKREVLRRLLDELQGRRSRDSDHVSVMEIAHEDGTALREWVGKARALLKRIEWEAENRDAWAICPECHGLSPTNFSEGDDRSGYDVGHRPGCELAALIGTDPEHGRQQRAES